MARFIKWHFDAEGDRPEENYFYEIVKETDTEYKCEGYGWSRTEIDKNAGYNLTIVEAEDWDDFHARYKDWFNLKDSVEGWLSPEGDFFGCKHAEHSYIARAFFKMEEEEMEDKGYIKISLEPFGRMPVAFTTKNFVTERQRNYLEDHGFESHDTYEFCKDYCKYHGKED